VIRVTGDRSRPHGTIGTVSRVLAVSSVCFSALTWLTVAWVYIWTLTESRVTLVVVLASGACLSALLAVVVRVRSPLAWLALVASLVFPVMVWEWLQSLHGDVFG